MKIVEIARSYLGEFEKPGNHGFKNPALQAKMEADGWKDGEAWCAYFQEMIWEEAYPAFEKVFDKLFSGSCAITLANFKKAGYEISTIPVPGALMIMHSYKDGVFTGKGHAGLVIPTLISNSEWYSIEGNTNSAGSREGDSVQIKKRSLMYYPTGLRVAGFVLIRETLKITE
jgi:hypothetical protein